MRFYVTLRRMSTPRCLPWHLEVLLPLETCDVYVGGFARSGVLKLFTQVYEFMLDTLSLLLSTPTISILNHGGLVLNRASTLSDSTAQTTPLLPHRTISP